MSERSYGEKGDDGCSDFLQDKRSAHDLDCVELPVASIRRAVRWLDSSTFRRLALHGRIAAIHRTAF